MADWFFLAPPNKAVGKSLGVTKCRKCGRSLTDPESVSRGVGPVCVHKHMGPRFHPSGSPQSVHAGGKGKGAPSKKLTRRVEKLPKMPPLKTAGIGKDIAERAKVRKHAMEKKYGTKFSVYVPNPLAVKQGKKRGMWWSDLPQAIYPHKTTKPLTDPRLEKIVDETFRKWKFQFDYVSFNTLKFGSGLTFEEVFGIVRAKYNRDPRSVKFTVNRLNDPVHVGLVR